LERIDVYSAIDGERRFQDYQSSLEERPDMVPEMSMGDLLLAMEENLERARCAWYADANPYPTTMEFVRKGVALGVKAGEQFGMPRRKYVIEGVPC
jgi:hypothetical protein